MVGFSSCFNGHNKGRFLARYSAPDTSAFTLQPGIMTLMHYHNNESRCVNVNRIAGWQMPAPNTLEFEVTYVSDISEESLRERYQIMKQPDGEWLFTRNTLVY